MLEQIQKDGNRILLALTGNIYVEEATIVREQLLEYLQEDYKYFVLDVNNLHYIDSSGLGVLVAIHKRALQNGGKVIIKGLQGSVKELFELTRLTNVFEIEE